MPGFKKRNGINVSHTHLTPPINNDIAINSSETLTTTKSIDSFFKTSSPSLDNINNLEQNNESRNIIEYQNIMNLDQNVNNNEQIIENPKELLDIMKKNKNNNNKIFNNEEIKKRVDILSENELTEIFKIIKNNNEKYSTNKNGIFINLSTLRKHTILEISNFLEFCDTNNKIINAEENERSKYKDILENT